MANFSRPIGLVVLLLIFAMAGALGGPSNALDAAIIRETAQWRNAFPDFTRFMRGFTEIGGAPVTLGIAAMGSIYLVVTRRPAAALLLVITVAGERLLVEQLKDWVARPRPSLEPLWLIPQSLAFPSGHSANSVTAFAAVALVTTGSRWRWATTVSALVLSVMVGLSRVYLGVHWPTDVIGGWALGLLTVGCAVEIGHRSGALPLEPEHDVVGRHLSPSRKDEAS